MRISLFISLFLFVYSFSAHAQDTLKRNVSLLKESPQIDSLIKSVVNISGNLKASENDSCILLYLIKNNNDAGSISSLHTLNHKQIIFDFSSLVTNKNRGYFEFNGYLVFVYGDDFMKEFFTYTKSKKEFTFIKPTTQEILFEIRHSMSLAVFYKNGVFNWGVH